MHGTLMFATIIGGVVLILTIIGTTILMGIRILKGGISRTGQPLQTEESGAISKG